MKKLYITYARAVLLFGGISLISILVYIFAQTTLGIFVPMLFAIIIGVVDPLIVGIYLIVQWKKLKLILTKEEQKMPTAQIFAHTGATMILFSVIAFAILISG